MNDDETLSIDQNQEGAAECDPLFAQCPSEGCGADCDGADSPLDETDPELSDCSPENSDPHSDPDPAAVSQTNAGDGLEELRGELTALRRELDTRNAIWSRLGRECEEFQALYPEASLTDLDDGIWEDVRRGVPIAAAFALAERKRSRTEELALESNQANQRRSSGAVSGIENDYFSPAEVRAMSRHEVRKNYQKIVRSMKAWH